MGRSPPRMRRLTLATTAAVLLLLASPGHADRDDRRPVVVSFTGQLGGDLSRVPDRLARVMATAVGDAGDRATRAPLDDVLALAGCGEASDDCLRRAVDLLEARCLILGEVEPGGDGKVAVRLRLVERSRPARGRRLVLAGDGAAALEAGFRGPAQAFWRDPDPPEVLEPRDTPAVIDPFAAPAKGPAPAPAVPEAGFSASRVDRLTWAVTAGGAGMALAGGVLLLVAADKQAQVDDAPIVTVEDFEALAALEASGRNYSRWGTALLMVGAVAATVGVALVIKQGGAPDSASVVLAPSVTGGGLGATLTVRGGR